MSIKKILDPIGSLIHGGDKKSTPAAAAAPSAASVADAAAKQAEEDRLKKAKSTTDTVLTQGLGESADDKIKKQTLLGA